MEADFVDFVSSCIVVLDGLLGANVEDLDDLVAATGGDASAVRVEFNRLYALVVIIERIDKSFGGHVPHLDSGILRT